MEQKTKIFKPYEVKTLTMEVKDVDTANRRVKVALASFDNIDSDNDIIRRGAFAKSIQERGPGTDGRRIAFLRHHDWEKQVGAWDSLEETSTHLVGIGDLGRSTDGSDALFDYQDGIIREHSIGFNYIIDKMEFIDHGGESFWEIKEVFLWEGSGVTFGSNELTPTLEAGKSAYDASVEKTDNEMKLLIGAIRNGKGTDERLYNIEMRLKVIQTKYNSLINQKPSVKDTIIDGKPPKKSNISDDQKAFYLNLLK